MVHRILLLISVFSFFDFLDLTGMTTPPVPVQQTRTIKTRVIVAPKLQEACSPLVFPEIAQYRKKYPEIIVQQKGNEECLFYYLKTEIFSMDSDKIKAVMQNLPPHTCHLIAQTPQEKDHKKIENILDRVERKRAFDVGLAKLLYEKKHREKAQKRSSLTPVNRYTFCRPFSSQRYIALKDSNLLCSRVMIYFRHNAIIN